MITLKVSDIVKHRLLYGKEQVIQHDYHNKNYLAFQGFEFEHTKDGVVMHFLDATGTKIVSMDHAISVGDVCTITDISGRIPITLEKA